jgi:hypothetical protein
MIFNSNDFSTIQKKKKKLKKYKEHFEQLNQCFDFENERYGTKYKYFLYFATNGSINFIQFHYRLIVHQGPSKFYPIYSSYLSKDNKLHKN